MASELIQSKKYKGIKYRMGKDGEKTYYVSYTVNGKSFLKKVGKHSDGIRENFCNIKRTDLINKAKNGLEIDEKINLDELAKKYHNTKMTNATYENMLSRYDFKIKPFFKNKAVRYITEAEVYQFQQSLIKTLTGSKGKGEKKMSSSTVNYYVGQLSSILNYGVDYRYLKKNVAKNVTPLSVSNRRERYLEISELEDLVKALEYDDDLLLFTELSISTGGRMGSIMKIKKKDVNLNDNTVILSDDKGKERYTAFLNKRTLKLLKKRLENLNLNDSIYKTKQRSMQRQMKKVLDNLFNKGLDKDDAKNRVVVHTLRHTFASHLAIKGTSIFKIQKLLNHKDIKHTMRYAKLSPDSGRDDIEGIW